MPSFLAIASMAALLLGSALPAQARSHHRSHGVWPPFGAPSGSAPIAIAPATSFSSSYSSNPATSAASVAATSSSIVVAPLSVASSSAVASSSPVTQAAASEYSLKSTWDATNFFDNFNFFTDLDPTNGFVQYVDQSTAASAGWAKVQNGKVYLGADSTTSLTTSSAGRKSTRLESKSVFSNGLLIADFDHLPGSACGIWPAFWVFNNAAQGSAYSEIDIIEAVALTDHSTVSMYTGGQCTMSVRNSQELGTSPRLNCALTAGGCGIESPSGTFGDSFNAHAGGVWALQLESDGIRIFHFPHSGTVPADIAAGKPDPTSAAWGKPVMDFMPNNCDITKQFVTLNTIFNIDFCGSNYEDEAWGGEDWTGCSAKTGVATCSEYVAKNPAAFKETYFLINSVKLFQK